jgi:hypothetical protein
MSARDNSGNWSGTAAWFTESFVLVIAWTERCRMGCLLALLARIGLLVVWLQTPLVRNGFHDTWILPLLGLLFVPITTLTYVVVYALDNGNVNGAAWLWVVLGLLFDLGIHGSGVSSNRTRVRRFRTTTQ